MNNYIEYDDKIAFHPGYYIKEILDESGLTTEEFAKRLDVDLDKLNLVIIGELDLDIDMAEKLSSVIGTSVSLWMNLQSAYNSFKAVKI